MVLMPWLIFGSLLAVIPVIIHLLHKQKTTPIEWGAMQFLLETSISQRRRRHIDHWLLMLVRMALLILLALLLARPILLQSKYNPLASPTAADIAIVLDHSLSMGRKNGQQTLFEQAAGQVEQVAKLMRPSDTLTVVLAEHKATALKPALARKPEEIQDLRQTLTQLRPGMTDASIPEAVAQAREAISHGGNLRKVILVLSDEQRSGWQIENEGAWRTALGDRVNGPDKDVQVYAMPVTAQTSTPNVAITALNVGPGLIGLNRPVQVTATVTNAGPGEMPAFPVRLIVGGQPTATQQVPSLPAGQSQTVRFDHLFNAPGSQWLAVQAEAVDALEADNRMTAAVQVWDRLPVLLVDGALTDVDGFGSSVFLQAAMEPDENRLGENTLVQPKVVSVTEAARTNLETYPVVVFNDVPRLPSEFVARLADYVQAGHGVWLILGPRTEKNFVNDVLGKTVLFAGRIKDARQVSVVPGTVPPGLDIKDPDHGSVSLLTAAERNALTGVALNQWWQLTDLGQQVTTVLASSAEGNDPLVVAHEVGRNGGRVVVWATSAEGKWNNLPLAHNFVPLVNETLFHLAAGTSAAQHRRLDAGQTLVWTGPATPAIAGAELLRPDGQTQRLQPVLTAGKYMASYSDTYEPGLYQLKFTVSPPVPAGSAGMPGPVYFSVNIDRRELDPTLLASRDTDSLKERQYLKDRIMPEGLAAALGAENRGTEVWPYAALAVLALLVLETYMTRRAIRLQSGPDVRQAGLPGGGAQAAAGEGVAGGGVAA